MIIIPEKLKEIDLSLGNKANALIRLSQEKLPVPAFIVINNTLFNFFINSQEFKDVSAKFENGMNQSQLGSISKILQDLFDKKSKTIDKYIRNLMNTIKFFNNSDLVIRSSANLENMTHSSFAGIFHSSISIKKDNLYPAIINCLKSTFSEIALNYLLLKKISLNKIKMAIIIQKMIYPIISGVVITNNHQNQMIVEFIPGHLSNYMQGNSDPFQIIIDRSEFKIIAVNPSIDKSHLIFSILNKLIQLSVRIENYFKIPQEIEWGYDNNIWIFQARSYTENISLSNQEIERKILWDAPVDYSSSYIYYYLFLNIITEIDWFSEETKNAPIKIEDSKLFLSHEFKKAVRQDFARIIESNNLINFLKKIDEDYQLSKSEISEFLINVKNNLNNNFKINQISHFLTQYKELLSRFMKISFSIRSLMPNFENYLKDKLELGSILNRIPPYQLPEEFEFQKDFSLYLKKIPKDHKNKETLLKEFFSKYEWLLFKMGITDFNTFLNYFNSFQEKENFKMGPLDNNSQTFSKSYEKLEEISDKYNINVQQFLLFYSKFKYFRTDINDFIAKIQFNIKIFFQFIANRLNLPIESFNRNTFEEIIKLITEKTECSNVNNINSDRIIIRYNKKIFNITNKIEDESQFQIKNEDIDYTNKLMGDVIVEGEFSGCIKKINTINDFINIDKNYIFILRNLKISYISHLVSYKRPIICEKGGLFSHAAILAREFGIPCIIGVKNLNEYLKDDDNIIVKIHQDKAVLFKSIN